MKTNYIRQAWVSMRQQPVVSSVSVIGTALAIFLIMIVVMMQEIKLRPIHRKATATAGSCKGTVQ